MSGQDEWIEIIRRIRDEGGPAHSPHMARLYTLAVEDGLAILESFRAKLGEERLRDLIHDLLAERLDAILQADRPRAYFSVALRRRAISWSRRPDAAVVEEPPDSTRERAANDTGEDERRAFVIDAKAEIERLSARDRAVVVAVGLGTDREEIARELTTSRANVDQIVSRVRKRFHGDGS